MCSLSVKLSAVTTAKVYTKTEGSASGFVLATEALCTIAANRLTKCRLGFQDSFLKKVSQGCQITYKKRGSGSRVAFR